VRLGAGSLRNGRERDPNTRQHLSRFHWDDWRFRFEISYSALVGE
jgi:hypothetical protein